MKDCRYVRAAEVAEMIGVSRAKAYKMVAEMNEELKAQNYLVISGRVPRKYLMEKLYQWKSQLVTAITNLIVRFI